jgi:hypothetical protein
MFYLIIGIYLIVSLFSPAIFKSNKSLLFVAIINSFTIWILVNIIYMNRMMSGQSILILIALIALGVWIERGTEKFFRNK